MSEWAPKRFWSEVTLFEESGKYGIRLDSRELKTPGKARILLPTEALAVDVASEWAEQIDRVDPNAMPYTRTANSAIDTVSVAKDAIVDMLAKYAETDLVCYRADGPRGLIGRQAEAWDPLLEWSERSFSARLRVTSGVMPVAQEQKALKALKAPISALNPFELAAFHDLVALSGSLVIGLAAARAFKSADDLWRASHIDDAWQVEQWGEDEEAAEAAEQKRLAFLHASEFFQKSGLRFQE